MGQHCSADSTPNRYEVLECEPRAVSLQRIRSLSSHALEPAAHMKEVQEGRKFGDDFDFPGDVLGHGLSGDVVMAEDRFGGGHFAVKTLTARHSSAMQHFTPEVEVYVTLSHPNIAKLHRIYEGSGKVFLVMECCTGGELYAKLTERGRYSAPDAAEAMRQMLRAVGYLHDHNVVHRDIKMENFLYASEEEGAELKLIDFGFAKVWDDPKKLMTRPCGSVSYVSPDVLHGTGYTNKCDMWSLGIVLWMLLSGYPPFHGEDDRDIKRKIKAGLPDWSHKSRWCDVPEVAVNMVKKLLDRDPLVRPSAAEAASHPFLDDGTGSTVADADSCAAESSETAAPSDCAAAALAGPASTECAGTLDPADCAPAAALAGGMPRARPSLAGA